MLDFEEIFGPGEFDDESNVYRREFRGIEAGGIRNALDFEVFKEHAERRGYRFDPSPTGDSKDFRVVNGDTEVEVENFPDGRTALEISLGDHVDDVESYMRGWVDQWIGEIFRREQKVYRAATRFVHRTVPRRAEEDESSEEEILSRELDFLNGDLSNFHDWYREGDPTDLTLQYALEFELSQFEDAEMKRSDLAGKMPLSDELGDEGKSIRNDTYLRRYLEAVIQEAGEVYDLDEGIREEWLEYAAGSGFRQAKV